MSRVVGYDAVLWPLIEEVDAFACAYCAVMLTYIVGIADDLIGIRYRPKFVAQVLCGCLMVAGGLWVNDLHGLFFVGELPVWLGYVTTVFVVIFVVNAINFIDGIDGLASGLCSVAFLFLGLGLMEAGEYMFAMIGFATLGVLMPFHYYNVFGNARDHKKIFMGDTGSTTIGMLFCVLCFRLLRCDLEHTSPLQVNTLCLAASPMIIPCFDVVRIFIHRLRHGQSPFLPDRNHIHHKVMALGWSQRRTMTVIVMASALFTLVNTWLSSFVDITLLLAADTVVFSLINRLISLAAARRNNLDKQNN